MLGKIAEALLNSPAPPTALVTETDWNSIEYSIRDWIAHGRERDALRDKLYQHYTNDLLKLDLEVLRDKLTKAVRKEITVTECFSLMGTTLSRFTNTKEQVELVINLADDITYEEVTSLLKALNGLSLSISGDTPHLNEIQICQHKEEFTAWEGEK